MLKIMGLVRSGRRLKKTGQPLTAENILAAYIDDNDMGDLDGIDWDALMAFVIKWLPIILALIGK